MNRRLQTGVFLLVAALAGYAGYYFSHPGLNSAASDAAAKKLMSASFVDLHGRSRNLSAFSGKILVINFWATWCPPCREEIPELKKVAAKYKSNDLEIVGIALDNVAKVRDYSIEMDIRYSLLIAGAETLAISKELGNQAGVLPFTVVLDRAGRVAYTHAGALTEAGLDAVLLPLL